MDKVPYRLISSVGFVPYSSAEIKKISVVEVTNGSVFDSLDHPADGGLHDRSLGPNEMNDLCRTCGLNGFHCPGHCGHINLPLPVFHPLFLGMLNKLLRGSCLKCHRLTVPARAIQLLIHQFEALDYGLIGTVQQLEEAVSDPVSVGKSKSAISLSLAMGQKLDEILKQAIADIDLEEAKAGSRVKNVVETRQRIMKSFIKDHLTGSSGGKCCYCGAVKKAITLKYNCRFLLSQGKKSVKAAVPNMIKQEKEDDNQEAFSAAALGYAEFSAKEVKSHLYELWKNDGIVLGKLFGVLNAAGKSHSNPMDIFFMDVVLVPPTRFRPINVLKGRKLMSPRTVSLKNVLQDCLLLNCLLLKMKDVKISDGEKEALSKLKGKTDNEKLHLLWYSLQGHVNTMLDAQMDKQLKDRHKRMPGVKQVLEAKEGLFRGHMMGKRVNYVARSVISPDPYIMADEIGVPEVFAKKLTYPEPVTPWNVEKLRAAVMNGPDVHPGAVAVESEDGLITRLTNPQLRRSFAARLLTPESRKVLPIQPKKVHRHLQNGDVLLLNRQPTLHKPSIMAHRARVLPGEKTLRLHYANCKAYNADFDGDEMNAHFPQNELARAEGYNIVSVNNQYLVPKDGTPLSGLIQDHIVAGTLLTMRGNFFTKEEYHQLVYNAIPFVPKIETLPPCIMKPQFLWSGKQVISTVLINVIPEGKQPVTFEGRAKLSRKNWQNSPRRYSTAGGSLEGDNMTESQVIVRGGELLCGVLDKAQIGPTPYGLVHCCYELYGGQTSNLLMTSLARLFTYFLQSHTSFTLGIEDILLKAKADKKRKKILSQAKKVGDEVAMRALGLPSGSDRAELVKKLKHIHLSRDDESLKQMDFEMKKMTAHINNEVNRVCMPNGLQKKFPQNNLQLLVQAGAKGSTVNTMQISCMLGQVELEGRRVPMMANGSTLPCFLPYDTSPRAGGFVDGRFLTGLQPPEYFFHCMAGREGLIDTAVKTSRSGYLQRCLIKHLEGIMINYDMTVRDSDGSVIQFFYGEDGQDVTKTQMLKSNQFPTLLKNYDVAINKKEVQILKDRQMEKTLDIYSHKKAVSKWQKRCEKNGSQTKRISGKTKKKCPDPLISVMRPTSTFGSVSEQLEDLVNKYIKRNPHGLLNNGQFEGKVFTPEMFRDLMYYRSLKSLAEPGEPVGLLAAQSIGEPSTQMTLNTFHFAGRGEMNVTLGIPRLREILMVASANIATPTMVLPLLKVPNIVAEAEKLRVMLTAVNLKQVLEYVQITDEINVVSKSECYREYKVEMKFLPHETYATELWATPASIFAYIEKIFIKKVVEALRKKLRAKNTAPLVSMVTSRERSDDHSDSENDGPAENPSGGDEGDGGASSDEEDGDDDSMAQKVRSRHNQDVDYEEAEEEDKIDEPSEDEEGTSPNVNEDETGTEVESDDNDNDESQEDDPGSKKASRIDHVKGIHPWVSNYNFSGKKRRCEFMLKLVLEGSSVDMKTLVEEEINKAVVHQVTNLKRAFVSQRMGPDGEQETVLQTEGVNFLEIFKYNKIIDMKRIYSNDIHSMAKFFGIEAADKGIVKEVSSVFANYGIVVDPRHLLLIADYMTFDGSYKPFNRVGLESSASPLQQMSFETPMKFFANATLTGAEDMVKSPSSKLIVGQVVSGGTGSHDLFVKLIPKKKRKSHY